MAQALSIYSEQYNAFDAAQFINTTGYFPEYNFERLRSTIPFLFLSRNMPLGGDNYLSVIDAGAMSFTIGEFNSLLHNPVAVKAVTRMSKGDPLKLALTLTNFLAIGATVSQRNFESIIQSLINEIQVAFYKVICQLFIDAMDNNVLTISSFGGSGAVALTADQDGVGTIDANANGFTEATLGAIQSYFYANADSAKVNIEDFYLVIPYSAREKWLETLGNPNNAVSYDTYAVMKNVTYIRGHPVYTPPNKFFKKETIGGKTGVVGYAVLRDGLTYGYSPMPLTASGMVNNTKLPLSARSPELQEAMFTLRADELPHPYNTGIGVRAEGLFGVMRSFRGAVVKILLPDEPNITIN